MKLHFVKGKKVILSQCWLFLNKKENKGQINMDIEICRRFLGKKKKKFIIVVYVWSEMTKIRINLIEF